MALVVPTVAAAAALTNWAGKADPVLPWILRLYADDVVPTSDMTAASVTEVSGGGYGAVVLDPAAWVFTAGAPSVAEQPPWLFAFTGATNAPGTVFGYYIVDGLGGIVLAQRLDSPPFVPAFGDILSVTLRVSLGSVSGD